MISVERRDEAAECPAKAEAGGGAGVAEVLESRECSASLGGAPLNSL